MYQVQHTVVIPRVPERVWDVFTDVPNWPKWNAVTPSARWLTEGQWRRGARLAITLRLREKRRLIRPQITTVIPNRRVTWVGHWLGVKGKQTFTFEPDGKGTRVTTTEAVSGLLLFVYRLLVPPSLMNAVLAQWLDALKAEAER